MAQKAFKEPMSNVDTAWYRMDSPTNLMIVNVLMRLHGQLVYESLKDRVDSRLLYFKRFRQRIVTRSGIFGGTFWEEDPEFNLDDHISEIEVEQPATQKELEALVSREMSKPLDYNHPLWHFSIVRGMDNESALLMRIHHCIADGSALVRVLLSLTHEIDPEDEFQDQESSGTGENSNTQDANNSRQKQRSIGRIFKPVAQLGKGVASLTSYMIHGTFNTLRNPGQIVENLRFSADSLSSLSRLIFRWPDSSTVLKGQLGKDKIAVWSDPYPLDDVKAVKKATGSTVNDVLVTALAGALRRYLISKNQSVDHLTLRAAVPVDLRRDTSGSDLGNKFGLVFLNLPVEIGDSISRLEEQKKRMGRLKKSAEAGVVLGVLSTVGMAPEEIEEAVVKLIGSKATLVMTNVRGPEKRLSLLGLPVEDVMSWVPQSGRVGLGVSVISYNNKVGIGIASDKGLIPDPQTLLEYCEEEFKNIYQRIIE